MSATDRATTLTTKVVTRRSSWSWVLMRLASRLSGTSMRYFVARTSLTISVRADEDHGE
jgi:hypothetical protein